MEGVGYPQIPEKSISGGEAVKINEVERQVGITKKNIRFYEDQGLISPERNLSNGYREYSERDVSLLLKIKLLRRLAIPIEEIRKLLEGRLTLLECMERHQISLQHEKHNLELISEMCEKLSQEEKTLSGLEADRYLEQLNEMEKEGVRFMKISKADVSKKKRGAQISATVMIVLIVLWDLFIFITGVYSQIPWPVTLLMTLPITMIIIGILLALRERMKEIDGGEEDEAANY